MRLIAMLAAAVLLTGGGASLAQEAETPQPAGEPSQTPAPQAEAPAADDTDDVFVPSEEVEADTAVAFPTDI